MQPPLAVSRSQHVMRARNSKRSPILILQPANFLDRPGHFFRHLLANAPVENVGPVSMLAYQRHRMLVALDEDVPPEDRENDAWQKQEGDDPVHKVHVADVAGAYRLEFQEIEHGRRPFEKTKPPRLSQRNLAALSARQIDARVASEQKSDEADEDNPRDHGGNPRFSADGNRNAQNDRQPDANQKEQLPRPQGHACFPGTLCRLVHSLRLLARSQVAAATWAVCGFRLQNLAAMRA